MNLHVEIYFDESIFQKRPKITSGEAVLILISDHRHTSGMEMISIAGFNFYSNEENRIATVFPQSKWK